MPKTTSDGFWAPVSQMGYDMRASIAQYKLVGLPGGPRRGLTIFPHLPLK